MFYNYNICNVNEGEKMSDYKNKIEVLESIFDLAKDNKSNSDVVIVCRQVLEKAIDLVFDFYSVRKPLSASLLELINNDTIKQFFNNDVLLDSLHFVRIVGNNALHERKIKRKQAEVACDNIKYLLKFLEDKLCNVDGDNATISAITPAHMSEAETRKVYIDTYLQEAGWEVVPVDSEYVLSNGHKVKCGSVIPAKACCEIPVKGIQNVSGVGFCDYVLYGRDGKPLAVVEAKKTSIDPSMGQFQVKEYGECLEKVYGYIPILYYTNGYTTYIVDGKYPARVVNGFHTISELELLINNRDVKRISDISIKDNITNRPYQKIAITKICERFNSMQRKGLLVMATGTGKTRVAISLVDVLARNNWIKNVLFLADRTSLVRQAFKNFKNLLPDMTYCVLSDKSLANEPNARITFSTHQTMINVIDAEDKLEYTIGRFDLIIIDEAHRSIFNKYGVIFSYFDSLLVGLTATPKEDVDANTYELFNCDSGEPNFVYSLEEAVRDKYLVPYKVVNKTTKLIQSGIKYKDLSIADKQKVDLITEESYDDESVINGSKLFKIIYNKDTCKQVLEDLMTKGLKIEGGQKLGKSIIFAYNHLHAKLIVDTFNEMYPQYPDYCQLIDNQVKNSERLIERFETEDGFRIAVSVDMLDTGIDVPSVLNLVFFKQVRSKIKFVQMIGRGTRLCSGLIDGNDKRYFLIFDYCGNFEYFDTHPDGSDGANGKSITQKLFEMRLDMLLELQKIDHQVVDYEKQYYKELKQLLHSQIESIKNSSGKTSVRDKMSYVDKYCSINSWDALSVLNVKEIKYYLTSLLDSDIHDNYLSYSFDLKMLKIEYAILTTGSIETVVNVVQVVRDLCKYLLQIANISEIYDKRDDLNELCYGNVWNNPTVEDMEYYRKSIRGLMKYISGGDHPKAFINTDDETITKDSNFSGLIDIRTYYEKVVDYLMENSHNKTIQKIKNLETLTYEDFEELENILWVQTGSKEDYYKFTKLDNLAVFIRSIVGIEQEAVNKKFGEYLNENYLTAQQQEFIYSIINYARENGDIIPNTVIYEAPFNNYQVLDLFGNKATLVVNIVNTVHNCVTLQGE